MAEPGQIGGDDGESEESAIQFKDVELSEEDLELYEGEPGILKP